MIKYYYITDDYIDFTDDKIIRWVYINNCKTKYMVTINGEIISIKKETKKILRHSLDKDGYHHVVIHMNGKKYRRSVHRLVAIAFLENPDSKPEVNHKDGNKNNNHASNLEWTTTKDNIHHAWETGLSTAKKGVIHPESKYTENQIRSVCRYLENNKFTMKEISELTGVTYTVVKQIRNHVIWRSISIDYNIDAYNIDSRKKKGKKKYENKL